VAVDDFGKVTKSLFSEIIFSSKYLNIHARFQIQDAPNIVAILLMSAQLNSLLTETTLFPSEGMKNPSSSGNTLIPVKSSALITKNKKKQKKCQKNQKKNKMNNNHQCSSRRNWIKEIRLVQLSHSLEN